MLRSMYSGVSGLKNFQTKLDVIGNNVANVNTQGFKKGRTTFKDLFSQQIVGASAPGANRGGMNSKQVGIGSQLSSIDTVHTQGSVQSTGRALDLAISGDGLFELQDVEGNTLYSRSGNFYLDEAGDIVNSEGYYLMGDGGPINIPQDVQSFSIGDNGAITAVFPGEPQPEILANVQLTTFPNPEGLTKAGGNLYQQSANSGEPNQPMSPGAGGVGDLISGALEMSNVDLSEEFTEMIVAQRGFQANTRMITTSDEILQELMQLKR